MIVKLKTSLSGPAGSFSPGIRDLPEDLAYEMIDAGFAEKVQPNADKQNLVNVRKVKDEEDTYISVKEPAEKNKSFDEIVDSVNDGEQKPRKKRKN